MKTITRRLFAAVLVPGLLLLSACGKKDSSAPGPAGVDQAAPAIAGPFTGVLTMKTTIPKAGTSDMKLYIGPKGMRAESKTSIGAHGGEVSMTILSLKDSPDKVYMINGETGACMELDVSKVKKQPGGDPYENAKIENLGKERVNGFDCNHVRISWADKKSTIDLWVSKDILDYFAYAKMQGSDDQTNTQLAEKLKAAGLDGFPVKTLISPEGVVTELVKAERITPDDKLFEVPANCTKLKIPEVPSAPQGMSKEKIKELQEFGRKMQQQMKQE
ncbi:DUF4412 domain-containing protein [Chlorobaculum sp. MV4-Y]|uniref:DUF4412 domain-containing protein n=1 Tax=Chlorobaculum sp. MV4-Y TaxID=2976335 RepID=UPI0021AE7A7C|nr:DUF4412 domain-containing protein [Chlorobaculum sp. MV4-Y]UWX57734.1 DUF4412 domain-containing protein [Chlorobaculum sp. MV4-Y]